MKLLVCGGRSFYDYRAIDKAIRDLPFRPLLIIQGGATGADSQAKQWAIRNGTHCAEVPALWDAYGKPAGGFRNSAMLTLLPDWCLAMPGGSGTADMVKKCRDTGISTTIVRQ